ncbi:trigger factor [Peptostreptococcus porci]|uniref:trigger factor n=1 Tax=Peptostreptococcus porci TaxID=2652282 RepID=UPI002A824579|nr:trigger factor [Peptostreptococcus porci]MDY4128419.1 trigger factor [Peptostreptococcus porci]MDY4561153.1 trigger factor [Peptostreptococcus porci]MDY5436142.1 trigger factor [Peptostreptococcus porci]
MKSELIKKEGYSVTFEMAIDAVEFDKAIDKAYNKTKSRYNIAGFRKGKAPRKIIELNYGKGVFFNDALDILLPEVYPVAVEELKLEVVSQPDIDIKEIKDDGGLVLVVMVDVKPEFTIENYFGVDVEKVDSTVTDEMIDEELNALLEKQSRMVTVESPVENGNVAVIDFAGTLDGVPFEGGTSEGYSLEVGSGTFIPGFEEQLVGKSTGDEFDVNVTFPEDYPAEELAGKPVVFKVKINEVKVKELPELDDSFAQDTTEFESLEELKNDIRTKKQEEADQNAKSEMRNKVVEKVAEGVEIDIPNSMVEAQLDRQLQDINMQLSYQGWSLEKFAELSGQSIEDIREARRDEAKAMVKHALIVEKIVELEKVEATDEDIEKDLENFAKMYQIEIDKIKSSIGDAEKENIADRIRTEKAVDLLLEKANLI